MGSRVFVGLLEGNLMIVQTKINAKKSKKELFNKIINKTKSS